MWISECQFQVASRKVIKEIDKCLESSIYLRLLLRTVKYDFLTLCGNAE